ncbi:MAG: SEC-C metal-binding domain-containing protein [Muribaculaceae bacterium]
MSIPTLEEQLRGYPPSELDRFAKILKWNFEEGTTDDEKPTDISKAIHENPEQIVHCLPYYNLQVLLDVANGKMESIDYLHLEEEITLISFGLVYAGEDYTAPAVLVEDFADVLRPLIEQEMKQRRESGRLELEEYFIGYANQFGVYCMDKAISKLFIDKWIPWLETSEDPRLTQTVIAIECLCTFINDQLHINSPYRRRIKYDEAYLKLPCLDSEREVVLGFGKMPLIKLHTPYADELYSFVSQFVTDEKELDVIFTNVWTCILLGIPFEAYSQLLTNVIPEDKWDGLSRDKLFADFVINLPQWKYNGCSLLKARDYLRNEVEHLRLEKERMQIILKSRRAEVESLRASRRRLAEYLDRTRRQIREKERAIPIVKKPGRNDPCPCGSGKKYKHCCGR